MRAGSPVWSALVTEQWERHSEPAVVTASPSAEPGWSASWPVELTRPAPSAARRAGATAPAGASSYRHQNPHRERADPLRPVRDSAGTARAGPESQARQALQEQLGSARWVRVEGVRPRPESLPRAEHHADRLRQPPAQPGLLTASRRRLRLRAARAYECPWSPERRRPVRPRRHPHRSRPPRPCATTVCVPSSLGRPFPVSPVRPVSDSLEASRDRKRAGGTTGSQWFRLNAGSRRPLPCGRGSFARYDDHKNETNRIRRKCLCRSGTHRTSDTFAALSSLQTSRRG